MSNSCPSPGAIRQHRHRQRQKLGRLIIAVELSNEDIGRLIDAGLLKEREGFDRQRIATAISILVEALDQPKN